MRPLPVEPPAFFHRGPSPLARLAFFGLISLALLFADTRFRYLENIRQVAAVIVYPLQRAVQLPGEALAWIATVVERVVEGLDAYHAAGGGRIAARTADARLGPPAATFRHPPPISFFSDQFLFYLKQSLADASQWAD